MGKVVSWVICLEFQRINKLFFLFHFQNKLRLNWMSLRYSLKQNECLIPYVICYVALCKILLISLKRVFQKFAQNLETICLNVKLWRFNVSLKFVLNFIKLFFWNTSEEVWLGWLVRKLLFRIYFRTRQYNILI